MTVKDTKHQYVRPLARVVPYYTDDDVAQGTPGFDTGSHPQAGDNDDKVKAWDDDLFNDIEDREIAPPNQTDVWQKGW